MPEPGVNIRVAVTGVDEAERALGAVGQAARRVQTAEGAAPAATRTRQATAAQQSLAAATERSAAAQVDFNRKAQSAVTSVVGLFSPALAGAARLVIDLAEGLGRVTRQLLIFAGFGAALGLVANAFRLIAERAAAAAQAVDRVAEAQRRARESAAQEAADLRQAALRFGLFGRSAQLADEARVYRETQGWTDEQARTIALAAAIAQAEGVPFAGRHFMAGLLAAGGTLDLGTTRAEASRVIEATQQRGREPDALRALDVFQGEHQAASATPEARLADLAADRPDLSEQDRAAVARIASDLPAIERELHARPVKDQLGFHRTPDLIEREIENVVRGREGWWQQWARDSGDVLLGEQSNLTVREAIRLAREINAGAGRGPGPATQPVVIIQQTHANAVYGGARGPRSLADYHREQSEWE